MITGISYVHLIAVACAFRLIIACTASNVPSAASVTSYATVTIVDASSPAAAAAATSDWEPRMIVNSVHPLTTNNLATADTLSERPMDSGAAYNAYYNGAQYNYSDSSEQGLGHYASHPNNQSYVAHFTDAYRQTASNNLMPVSPNHIMSRINVQPLQNEVTTKPNIFNTPYMNTFREIRSTVVTIFQRVQEFVSYMFNFFTIGKWWRLSAMNSTIAKWIERE